MSEQAKHILSNLLELPINQRIWVVQAVLESFSDEAIEKETWDRPAFYAEMDRRLKAYDSGEAKGIPAKQALDEIQSLLS